MSEKREMINPRLLRASRVKILEDRFSGKHLYRGYLGGRVVNHWPFRRASEAQAYTERLLARWIRLYDAAVIAMVSAAEEK